MDKNYIKERLQEKNRRIRLPKAIEFKLDGGELRLTVSGKGVVANMQDNGSAFEGWAICIKSRMKEVEKVVVGWEQPDYSRDREARRAGSQEQLRAYAGGLGEYLPPYRQLVVEMGGFAT